MKWLLQSKTTTLDVSARSELELPSPVISAPPSILQPTPLQDSSPVVRFPRGRRKFKAVGVPTRGAAWIFILQTLLETDGGMLSVRIVLENLGGLFYERKIWRIKLSTVILSCAAAISDPCFGNAPP